jgi:eukaryotic-like serine/threonine-protein kinase
MALYRVLRKLGEGNGGSVVLATAEDGAHVAIKRPLYWHVAYLKLLESEAAVLAAVEHPAVPRFVEYWPGDQGELPALVMGYADGPQLWYRWTFSLSGPKPRVADAAALLLPVCDALEHMHARGWAFRDMNPQNVICTPTGGVLIDFGSAQQIGAPRSAHGMAEQFAPPDWRSPGRRVSVADDVYGFAATLHFMLARSCRRPGHVWEPGRLCQYNPDVSPELDALIRQGLAHDASARPSLAAFREALSSAIQQSWAIMQASMT